MVFNNCIICHGGSSGDPAAGLNLTSSNSYASLVGQISTNSTRKRVEPGSVSGSFIIDVLRKQQTRFIHTISNSIEEEDIELIEHWIEAGAINN